MSFVPRLIRAVPEPLGTYLRPSRIDQKFLVDFLSEGRIAGLDGVVFDASLDTLQHDLRIEVEARRLPTVIDFRAMELATDGGFSGPARKLPWAGSEVHTVDRFAGDGGRRFIDEITAWTLERRFTAVLAPTHYLADGARDPWFSIDRESVTLLRNSLDKAGGKDIPIYYPLATRGRVFFDPTERERLRMALLNLPIDAVWLRIHPFGARSGAHALRRYIHACADFHPAGVPLVAERSGTAGLALLAFGSVGAIETGVTIGEHFDIQALAVPRPAEKGFTAQARVYFSNLQVFLSKKQAQAFFESRGAKAYYACKREHCCRRGAEDMLGNPRRHFTITRLDEINVLSAAPESLRPGIYMDQFLRPATDMIVKASGTEPALATARHRLDSWRAGLGATLVDSPPVTFSAVPTGRRIQVRIGA